MIAGLRINTKIPPTQKLVGSATEMHSRAMLTIALFGLASTSLCHTPTPFIVREVKSVFDGDKFLERRSVLLKNGRVARVADGKLYAPGNRILRWSVPHTAPGVFDSHAHTSPNPKAL